MKYFSPLLMLLAFGAAAQNHVPNCSFEQYINCPGQAGEVNNCTSWRLYTNGTSDYYNACNTNPVGVPANMFGYQPAIAGNAYCGFYTYSGNNPVQYKEYIAATITPLQTGKSYEVSIYASLSDWCAWGTNDLGVLFYDAGSPTITSVTAVMATPQVSYSGYGAIVDTGNWVRLTGALKADSSYDNIVIGGFKDYNTLTKAAAPGNQNHAYYYIDSVTVQPLLRFNTDTVYCAGDTIIIPYTTVSSFYSPGNVFIAQLSNATGSFSSPVTIGTVNATASGTITAVLPATAGGAGYRIRILSTNTADTSFDNGKNILINPAVPSSATIGIYASPNDTLCINNASVTLTAVPGNAGPTPQYQWFKNNNIINNATNISYLATGVADGDSFYCRMVGKSPCAPYVTLYSNKLGMTVLPLAQGPSVSITADPGTLLSPWQLVKFTAVASNAGALPRYQWKRNSQDVIGANSDTWSANNLSNSDTISCVVTSDVWCASPAAAASNRMVVNIKTGITDIDGDEKVELYPNPNNGSFVVHLPATFSREGHVDVSVVDILGKTIYLSEFLITTPIAIGTQFQITLPATVANGVYILKLHAGDGMYHARFTVSR